MTFEISINIQTYQGLVGEVDLRFHPLYSNKVNTVLCSYLQVASLQDMFNIPRGRCKRVLSLIELSHSLLN